MRVTLQDIATDLGLSKMTVSRALNNRSGVKPETLARVHAHAKKVGYQPDFMARGLATRRTYAVALVLPELSHTYYAEVAIGVEDVLDQYSYNLIVCHSHGDPKRERRLLDALLGRRVDAIILAPMVDRASLLLYRRIQQAGIPLVFLGQWFPELPAHYVYEDAWEGARLAVEHFLTLHYSRIALLAGAPVSSATPMAIDGYQSALQKAGISWQFVLEAGWTEEEGFHGMQMLLSRVPDVRAIVCANDYVAIGALAALQERNVRVPEDIALIGGSDVICARHVAVPLTSVSISKKALGKAAAEICMDAIKDALHPLQRIVFTPTLVVRRSCGASVFQREHLPTGLPTESPPLPSLRSG